MTHTLTTMFIALLLMTSYVAAQLQIAGVYYDPVQAETGGEAIQLENNGSTPLTLDAFTIETKTSSFPLPKATLLPGQGYLITDNNWTQLKDNTSWPDADYELGLSLANTAGYVAILDGEDVVDKLEWNASFKAREGYMLTHNGEAIPSFHNSRSTTLDVPASIIVTDSPPIIGNLTMTDDAPTPGIQLLSFNRVLSISIPVSEPNNGNVTVTATLFGETTTLTAHNGTYSGELTFSPHAPGDYAISITADDGQNSITQNFPITILSSTSITTSGTLEFMGAPGTSVSGSFAMTNEGNVAKTVTVQQSIPGATCDTATVVLAPDESKDVTCTVTIPHTAAGTYSYTVHLLAS